MRIYRIPHTDYDPLETERDYRALGQENVIITHRQRGTIL
jgi:hypothetical protein